MANHSRAHTLARRRAVPSSSTFFADSVEREAFFICFLVFLHACAKKKKSNVRHQAHILQVRCDISGPMSISATAATGEVSGGTHTGCHCVPPLLPQPLIDTVILIQQHLHVSTCFIPPQAGTDIIFIRPLKGNRKNKIASSDLFAFFTPTSSLLERNVFLFFLAAQIPHCSSREFAFPWFDLKCRMDQWLLEPENKVISELILVLVAVGGE